MKGNVAKDGDVNIAPNGYHYTKHKGKWRLTHHIVAEDMLGRPLDNERVYFKDKDKTNIVASNLRIVKIKKTREHRIQALKTKIRVLQEELRDLERA